MKKIWMRFLLVAVAIVTAGSLWGCTRKDDAVARFKGGILTVQDLDAHYEKLKKSNVFRNKREELTPEFVFDHALNMEMIIARGLEEKLHLDPRIRAEIHGFMSDLFLKIMQDSLVPEIKKEEFTETQLKEFYQTHKESYTPPSLLSVRMIKTADESRAMEARRKIETRQMGFMEAAETYSTDSQTAGHGGDIGTRALEKFRPAWQEIIGTLEPDQLTGPHRIKDAWYLFELTAKTEPMVHSFEEKKAYIRNDLLYAKYREAWQDTYDRLKDQYKVKVDENRLAEFIRVRKGKEQPAKEKR